MTEFINIHPINPQQRLILQVVEVIKQGGVIVYPTDSTYALGCRIGDKQAMERIRQIRQLDDKHNFTLTCQNLSEIATYARVDNIAFRFIKAHIPGPYTFILPATKEVPRRLQHPKRKTIGLRVPDHKIVQAILKGLAEPLISTSLILPERKEMVMEPEDIYQMLENRVDLVIDGGYCGYEETTIVDFTTGYPNITRYGKGEMNLVL